MPRLCVRIEAPVHYSPWPGQEKQDEETPESDRFGFGSRKRIIMFHIFASCDPLVGKGITFGGVELARTRFSAKGRERAKTKTETEGRFERIPGRWPFGKECQCQRSDWFQSILAIYGDGNYECARLVWNILGNGNNC